MKIYTRTGDRGDTGLFGGGRVPKDDTRVEAYGDVDELNSVLGVVASGLEKVGLGDLVSRVRSIQSDLFTLGALLATPRRENDTRAHSLVPPLPSERIALLESWIDEADAELEPLRHFILPGGTEAGAHLHLARTVCRRAERRVVTLARSAAIDERSIIYLNRLSDLLFTLARLVNHRAGMEEVAWVPNPRPGDDDAEEPR